MQCGDLSNIVGANANFSLTPADGTLTIYPGETTTVTVQVNALNGATGTVTLSGRALPQGISIASTTATIGSTATLSITATSDVVSSCFTGAYGVWTADRALTLQGTNATGTSIAQVDMNVVLENPGFLPTTTYLPVITVNTTDNAAVTSEDDYVDGTMTITDASNPSYNYTGTLGIKGHGNSTWSMPKKPYRLNLDSKAPLFGMNSSGNWILLANYDDKAMLRNDVSLQMSKLFGMAWTPNAQWVEFYLNGQYEGVYEITEKVEVSKARLNIGSMDDTDNSGTNLTGGYLAEINQYEDETLVITSQDHLPITLDDPDPPTSEQAAYFTSAFNAADASFYTTNWTDPSTGWQSYWDAGSTVNWMLVEDLADNTDADDWSSDYFYKPRGDDRFYRGPVWDMDLTFGNSTRAAVRDPSQPTVETSAVWYERLKQDPAFVTMTQTQWAAVRPQAESLLSYIDTEAAMLQNAANNNYARWPVLNETLWPGVAPRGSFQNEVDAVKSFLTQRIAYMDKYYAAP